MKSFFVFMCPKCRNFTNAPVGQKRRRCSYCGHIIDIRKAAKAVFDSPQQASSAVKAYNASRGGDDFEKAVERSKARVLAFMPSEPIRREDLAGGKGEQPSQGKRGTLMRLLGDNASKEPCPLDRLEDLCSKAGLDWNWVERQIQGLSNSGQLVFPRPWTVRLVVEEKTTDNKETRRDVSLGILTLLSERGRKMKVRDIIRYFEERGVAESSVEESLEKLMRSGEIYEPKTGLVSLL